MRSFSVRLRLASALAACSLSLFGQSFQPPRRGEWIPGPRINRRDLADDAVTSAVLNFGSTRSVANLMVACNGATNGPPVLALRAAAPVFPGSENIPDQARVTIGADVQPSSMKTFLVGQHVVFELPVQPSQIALLANGRLATRVLSIAFTSGGMPGLIAATLPPPNNALEGVLNACGLFQSIPNSETSARSATSRTESTSVTKPTEAAHGSSKDPENFEIEGIKLGMTLQEASAVAKHFGTPKVVRSRQETTLSFKTHDINFAALVFGKDGELNKMALHSIRSFDPNKSFSDDNLLMQSSQIFQKALEAFGKPDVDAVGSDARWTHSNGNNAEFFTNGEALEITLKQK